MASGIASATVLVAGFHDFDSATGLDNTPDYQWNSAGISASVDRATNSTPAGGSGDGTFGTSALVAAGANDGFVNIISFTATRFSVANNKSWDLALETLLFDFAGTNNSQTLTSTYVITEAGVPVGGNTLPSVTSSTGFGPAANPTSYQSYALDLTGITLGAGQIIQFTFTGASGGLDNIGLLAVPEPGSLVALGCVLGSGLLLRSRRRSSASAEVAA